MVRRPHLPTVISRATTPRFIRTRVATKLACSNSSGSSRFPEASAHTALPRRPGAFNTPELIVPAASGGGESETGRLATAWHANKFLNPIRDGAVLPVLHLNG